MTSDTDAKMAPNCELCGEPMPPGEEMFKYHGYSGPCPNPPAKIDPNEQAWIDLRDDGGLPESQTPPLDLERLAPLITMSEKHLTLALSGLDNANRIKIRVELDAQRRALWEERQRTGSQCECGEFRPHGVEAANV